MKGMEDGKSDFRNTHCMNQAHESFHHLCTNWKENYDKVKTPKDGSFKMCKLQVDLGFPDEFLAEPEAEIAHLKMMCDDLISR